MRYWIALLVLCLGVASPAVAARYIQFLGNFQRSGLPDFDPEHDINVIFEYTISIDSTLYGPNITFSGPDYEFSYSNNSFYVRKGLPGTESAVFYQLLFDPVDLIALPAGDFPYGGSTSGGSADHYYSSNVDPDFPTPIGLIPLGWGARTSDSPFVVPGMFQASITKVYPGGGGGGSSAAPEPALWMMMLLGFGLVGASMRRKQRLFRWGLQGRAPIYPLASGSADCLA